MGKYPELTQLMNDWRSGDPALLNDIIPAVYDELHRIARGYMRNQAPEHTLQATALVNEAFLRLGNINSEVNDRGHFIGIVANLMRNILVDYARAKGSKKRGGDLQRVNIDDTPLGTDAPSIDVMALESVLASLETSSPRKVRVAELYYFCGMTYAETAAVLEISEATLHRELRMLRTLLARRLTSDQ